MKQFRTVLRYELKSYFANKVFVGVTLFLVAVIAAVMFFPRLKASLAQDAPADAEERPVMLVICDAPEREAMLESAFSAAFPSYRIVLSGDDDAAVRQKIVSGEAECAFRLNGLTDYTYCVDDLTMYDDNAYTADAVLQRLCRLSAMLESGMTPEQAEAVMSVQITHTTEKLGKDQMQNFFYTYIMIFALYMVILLYGQMVATGVATEKSSRAMELLITSVRPVSMMFGKVIAACLAGLSQLVAVFGSALLFYGLNRSEWGNNEIISSIFDMPVDLFLYMLLFFVLGFFIYAFLFGAVGSTASKLEDINTSSMPITLLFVFGFVVVMMSMATGNVDTLLMKVCSFLPFTSPMAMFTRIAMSTPSGLEIAVSALLLVASVVGVGVLSAKIYRVGVLLYGTPPKLGAILKAVKKS